MSIARRKKPEGDGHFFDLLQERRIGNVKEI